MAKFSFDVAEVEVSERGDFEVMPKGDYVLKATENELKETKSGDGEYLAVTFEVVKPGQFAGRKVWQNFNISNPSEKAQKIGREQVAGWARAAGKPNVRDSDELLDRPFACKLDIEKGTGGYSDKNRIVGFLTPEAASSAPKKETAQVSKFEEEAPAPAPKKEAPAAGGKKKQPWD